MLVPQFPLLTEALRLQKEARSLLLQQRAGAGLPAIQDQAERWLADRMRLAECRPASGVDTLAVLHGIKQAAAAVNVCREEPDEVAGLAAEITAGLNSAIAFIETAVGVSRDECGLFDAYTPPEWH